MTDLDYAKLCAAVYVNLNPGIVGRGLNTNIHVDQVETNDATIFCFRGSKEPLDWIMDFWAVPALALETIADMRIGLIHTGFYVGAKSVEAQIAGRIYKNRPYALTGHSLGGALALVTGALLIGRGLAPPQEIVTFGAPRAGMMLMKAFLRDVPIRQYRFGADSITLVPTHPYMHMREPLIQIGTPIMSTDLFANHHIEHYITALQAPPADALPLRSPLGSPGARPTS